MRVWLKRLTRADSRGVSPVIGVILLVGITVILASVAAIGLFDIAEMEQVIEQAKSVIDGSALQVRALVVQPAV